MTWEPFSWQELRTLRYLWKCRPVLTCEGSTWNIYGKFRLVILFDTIDSLCKRGCIRRVMKYECAEHDDYELTPFGQEWAEKTEQEFEAKLQERIDAEINTQEGKRRS